MKKANILSNMETASSGIKTQQSGKIVKRRQPSGGKPGKKCTISDRFNYRDPDLPIDCEDLMDSSATSGLGRKGTTKKPEHNCVFFDFLQGLRIINTYRIIELFLRVNAAKYHIIGILVIHSNNVRLSILMQNII